MILKIQLVFIKIVENEMNSQTLYNEGCLIDSLLKLYYFNILIYWLCTLLQILFNINIHKIKIPQSCNTFIYKLWMYIIDIIVWVATIYGMKHNILQNYLIVDILYVWNV